MRHKAIVGVAAVGSLFFMGYIGKLMGSEFVNAEDRGQFVVDVELPAGTSLDETARYSAVAEQKMLANPEFKTVFATLGPDGEVNKVKWRVVTTPKSERTATLEDLKDVARNAALSLPNVKVAVTDPPFVEGAATEAPIMINVRGTEFEDIEAPLAKSRRS